MTTYTFTVSLVECVAGKSGTGKAQSNVLPANFVYGKSNIKPILKKNKRQHDNGIRIILKNQVSFVKNLTKIILSIIRSGSVETGIGLPNMLVAIVRSTEKRLTVELVNGPRPRDRQKRNLARQGIDTLSS